MAQPCVVCGAPGATVKKALNGLPFGVVICATCRDAVMMREVGIVRRPDDTLHITDGRT